MGFLVEIYENLHQRKLPAIRYLPTGLLRGEEFIYKIMQNVHVRTLHHIHFQFQHLMMGNDDTEALLDHPTFYVFYIIIHIVL